MPQSKSEERKSSSSAAFWVSRQTMAKRKRPAPGGDEERPAPGKREEKDKCVPAAEKLEEKDECVPAIGKVFKWLRERGWTGPTGQSAPECAGKCLYFLLLADDQGFPQQRYSALKPLEPGFKGDFRIYIGQRQKSEAPREYRRKLGLGPTARKEWFRDPANGAPAVVKEWVKKGFVRIAAWWGTESSFGSSGPGAPAQRGSVHTE